MNFMNNLSMYEIDKLLPVKWEAYSSWLNAQNNPAKSYKEHPFNSEEELKLCKKDFQKFVGISLGKYIRLKRVNYLLQQNNPKFHTELMVANIDTVIGKMLAVFFEEKLCLLEFFDRKMLEKELLSLQKLFKANFSQQETLYGNQLQKQLDEYFQGNRKNFDIAMYPVGTEFQIKVWDKLLAIPYGKTSTYKQQAVEMGDLNAIRAIASANGCNKISILIPCHRVIGTDGSLVGYGGGIERKRFLLELEKASL